MRDERTTTKTEARATQPMQWKLEAESRNCDHSIVPFCQENVDLRHNGP